MLNAFLPFWGLLKRELIRDLRRPRPMILLGGVLFVAAFVVVVNYPSAQIPRRRARTARAHQRR